jgi:hypothetical protein
MACRGCGLQRRDDPLLVSRKWNGLCCSICHSLQVRGPFRGRLPKSGDPLLQAFKEASLAKRQLAFDRLHRQAAQNGPPTAAIAAQGLPTQTSLSRMTDAELWRMHSLLLGSLRMVSEEMMARHQEKSSAFIAASLPLSGGEIVPPPPPLAGEEAGSNTRTSSSRSRGSRKRSCW